MGHALRWVLLLPAVLGTWLGVFYLFADYHRSLTAPCESAPSLPQCTDPLNVFLVNILPSLGAAVSAVLVLYVTFLMAPSKKLEAVRICFGVGAAIAFTGAWINAGTRSWDMLAAACSALLVGIITVAVASRVTAAKSRA